ncbi:MAG: FAD-dependent oxidoreductase [Armatimonadota bacterium]|nr:FAD-dependent oxidoreductase [Armatimonadota bacterium]
MPDISSDVVIVGGSLGGVAAALRAGRMGLSVSLVEDSDWIGGQLTAQGVCTPDETHLIENGCGPAAYLLLRHNIRQYYKDTFALSAAGAKEAYFNPGACWVGYLSVEPKVARDLLTEMLAALPNVTIYLNTTVTGAETSGNSVTALAGVDSDGAESRFVGRFFLDATDLGDLLPLCGVEYVLGADSRLVTGEPDAQPTAHPDWIQPMTVPFALELRPYGEDHTIPEPDQYAEMKALQNYRIADGGIDGIFNGSATWWSYRRILAASQFNDPAIPTDISMINTASNDYQGGSIPTGDPAADAETIRLARLASLGYVYWLQTECPREDGKAHPGYPELKFRGDLFDTDDGLAPKPYIREGRRIRALKTIVEQDIVSAYQPEERADTFPDGCGIGLYWLDVHAGSTPDPEVFLEAKPFQIPLGALVPVRVTNLLPACKNIGLTHLTNGAYRLHPIEWNIGESAGALAAFCISHNVLPQDVPGQPALLRAYQQSLLDSGNPIYWWADVPAGHPAFVASQWLGMWGIITGAPGLQFQPDSPMTDGDKAIIAQRLGQTVAWPSGRMTRAQAATWLYNNLSGGTGPTAAPLSPLGLLVAAAPAASGRTAISLAPGLSIAPGKPAAHVNQQAATPILPAVIIPVKDGGETVV